MLNLKLSNRPELNNYTRCADSKSGYYFMEVPSLCLRKENKKVTETQSLFAETVHTFLEKIENI